MSVAFKSQTAVAYESTSTIEWYGDTVIGYIKKYFVNAIDFTFEVDKTDFTNTANELAKGFESVLTEFGIIAKAIDFTNKAKILDHDVEVNKIKHSQELS